MQASQFVQVIEERQGLKIGAIEEAAYRQGFITKEELKVLATPLLKSGYGKHLIKYYRRLMKATETKLKGCFVIEPRVFNDDRGYFFESYNREKFDEITGYKVNFVQDNESFSTKGVLRGLHFQKGAHAQAKLVRVTHGEVLDVAVDIRPDSETFLQVVTERLSAENKKQLFVPRGFAHGFIVLSDTVVV